MLTHLDDYSHLGSDGASADLPPGVVYENMAHRVSDMAKHSTHAGEFEIAALSQCLGKKVVVLTSTGVKEYGDFETKIMVKYTSFGVLGSGHYEAIIEE